jgi:hypothetical protein
MSDSVDFQYWLATSAISFSGTCTTLTSGSSGKQTKKYQSTASLTTRADITPSPASLTIKDGRDDNKLSFGLTEDGRLISSELDSTGEGATFLGAAVSIITTVVTIVATAVPKIVADVDTGTPTTEPSEEGFPGQQQLDQLTNGEKQLTAYLIQLSEHIVGDADGTPASRPGPDDLSVVRSAFDLVSQQRDRLTQEQVAWESAGQTTSSKSGTYTVDVGDLPTSSPFDPKEEIAAAARSVWNDLGVMMCVVDDPQFPADSSPNDNAPFQNGAANSIWYRRPRRVRLDLWKRKDEDGEESEHAELIQSSQADIVDRRCTHIAIPLSEGGFFGHNTISVKVGTLGTPISISDDRVPSIANAATALAKAPSLITGGITDESGIVAAWQKAVPSAAAQQTAALEAQKDRLQLLADIKKLGGEPEE